MYTYIYIYILQIHICVYIHTYTYIYIYKKYGHARSCALVPIEDDFSTSPFVELLQRHLRTALWDKTEHKTRASSTAQHSFSSAGITQQQIGNSQKAIGNSQEGIANRE